MIFPKSAVAFLILAIRDIASQQDCYALEEKIVERYSEMVNVYSYNPEAISALRLRKGFTLS